MPQMWGRVKIPAGKKIEERGAWFATLSEIADATERAV
jgi:hypothetical protein